jgi:AraC-like DNA-binding protein
MISLDRLLNGLDVEVELLPGETMSSRCAGSRVGQTTPLRARRCGAAVFELVGGSTLCVSPHRVIVVPPSRGGKVVVVVAEDRGLVVTGGLRVRVSYGGAVGLFDDLAEPLVEDLSTEDPIRQAFDELLDEIADARPGYRAMSATLLRRCLVLLLRRHFPRGIGPAWLAALDDGRLGRAISAMRDRPEHCFTLAELAEVAGMSRSVFAVRFASALAKSPIEFLKALRLERAADLLSRTDLPVKAVAAKVGYSSRSAFTRAFVARHGTGPTIFRMATRAPDPDHRPTPSVQDAA